MWTVHFDFTRSFFSRSGEHSETASACSSNLIATIMSIFDPDISSLQEPAALAILPPAQ